MYVPWLCPNAINAFACIVLSVRVCVCECARLRCSNVYEWCDGHTINNKLAYDEQNDEHRYETQEKTTKVHAFTSGHNVRIHILSIHPTIHPSIHHHMLHFHIMIFLMWFFFHSQLWEARATQHAMYHKRHAQHRLEHRHSLRLFVAHGYSVFGRKKIRTYLYQSTMQGIVFQKCFTYSVFSPTLSLSLVGQWKSVRKSL